jgi:hypothetical protein
MPHRKKPADESPRRRRFDLEVTMVCETRLKSKQTIQQRADEIRRAVARLSDALVSGRVKVKVGPQGAITFVGWDEAERDGVTDACAYRRLMVSGSALAKAAIAMPSNSPAIRSIAVSSLMECTPMTADRPGTKKAELEL